MNPNFIIGQCATLFIAPDIKEGLKKEKLHLLYNDSLFCFSPNSQDFIAYNKYINSTENRILKELQRNQNRLMLSNLQGFDAQSDEIRLNLQKTDYSHACYVWNHFKHTNYNLKLCYSHIKAQNQLLPNSLCMHLLIETVDEKIVTTTSSLDKTTDYPNTIAFSVGEQLELSDIIESKKTQCSCADIWLNRTFLEEFGLTNDHYKKMVDTDSFRILGLYFEGNIYNFALLCLVRLKCSFNEFYEVVTPTLDYHEISDIACINFERIPSVLRVEGTANICHPSSAIRLFLYSMHKEGMEATMNSFRKEGIVLNQIR